MGPFNNYVALEIEIFATHLCVKMQHLVKFKSVIFDMQTIIFDWVFHVRKTFNQSETLKDKIQQSEQKEQQANQKNERKKIINP